MHLSRTSLEKLLMTLSAAVMAIVSLSAQTPAYEKTLRLDYIFTGTNEETEISLAKMKSLDGWHGRRVNMDNFLLEGNGQVKLYDAESGKLLYINTFSTLFREWQNSEEATKVRKSFEVVLLVPMPQAKARVTVDLFNDRKEIVATYTHEMDPSDILIQPVRCNFPSRYIHKAGDSKDCIDIAFVAEGYTAEEADLFYSEAQMAMEQILAHEPFKSLQDRLNFVAVAAPSQESGISVPNKGLWKNTALGSHYDTFYSDRYLTTLNIFKLHDALASVPYEHIIILANTETYGGGGIYGQYMMSSTRHAQSKPVIVHEFGHSFAGLADEYFYDDQYEQFYFSDIEPWEPNITTLVDFDSKWKDMLDTDKVVTKADQLAEQAEKRAQMQKDRAAGKPVARPDYSNIKFEVGLYEGGGYLSEGVYRPVPECRMKINEYPEFCPVCKRAITRYIEWNTVE